MHCWLLTGNSIAINAVRLSSQLRCSLNQLGRHGDVLDCRSVYGSILGGHLEATDFEAPIKRLGTTLINAALDLHAVVANAFLPSAVKFHYQFNLRELSTITEVRVRLFTRSPIAYPPFRVAKTPTTYHQNCFMPRYCRWYHAVHSQCVPAEEPQSIGHNE